MDSIRPDPKLKSALDVLDGWEARVTEALRALEAATDEYNTALAGMQAARQEALRLARKMFGLLDGE